MTIVSAPSGGPFGAWKTVKLPGGPCRVAALGPLAAGTGRNLERLPYCIRVLLENALRHCGRGAVGEGEVLALLDWDPAATARPEFAFMPGRVLLQDFTGVPCVVDLAALRSAVARAGRDAGVIDPLVPVDLVIDHSVQMDFAGVPDACRRNMDLEMERNAERYALLRWAQSEFANLRVVPPGAGICHQVNLEYLAEVVRRAAPAEPATGETSAGAGSAGRVRTGAGARGGAPHADVLPWAFPDTLIGTDSHTTMINGLGVLGWGVGGIEAEAVMLGQPYGMLVPQVVGVRLTGRLPERATATDLVLTVTELLRSVGVVNRFVEYFGLGAEGLSVADRATLANMSPEYGATCGFFPVDGETIAYLRLTGRAAELCDRAEAYCREQALFREPSSACPEYSWVVELDLGDVRPSLAGPRRPQDRVLLEEVGPRFRRELPSLSRGRNEVAKARVEIEGKRETVHDGDVVIASVTSCTNTSNPTLMLAAGLVARKAVALGLAPKPWVRTGLAPGSRAVTGYLREAGLLEPLEKLGFAVAGYGCATCIGNSGPLGPELEQGIADEGLVVTAVLSGNRNFEARIHPAVRANYLASPPLVVAYALAGSVVLDLERDPLGIRADGRPIFLSDLWPSPAEVAQLAGAALRPELFVSEYEAALRGTEAWRLMPAPHGSLFAWDSASTYVREPPFFDDVRVQPPSPADVRSARILAILGDSVTTDHISPAGSIGPDSPAGRYLAENGVATVDFNTYGARRGNHEVLMRGTFANVRLSNRMAGGREGGWTTHYPSGETLSIYDAAMRYREEGTPLVVLAGKEYGAGSSRDWAAKGPALLGVKAVVAESFERIHRSNLVGMGVLPLELPAGVTADSLGLHGSELVDIEGLASAEGLAPGGTATVGIRRDPGTPADAAVVQVSAFPKEIECRMRLDSTMDVEYFRHGGVLPWVLQMKLA